MFKELRGVIQTFQSAETVFVTLGKPHKYICSNNPQKTTQSQTSDSTGETEDLERFFV